MFAVGVTILSVLFLLAANPATRRKIDDSQTLTRIAGWSVLAALWLMASSILTLLWRVLP